MDSQYEKRHNVMVLFFSPGFQDFLNICKLMAVREFANAIPFPSHNPNE